MDIRNITQGKIFNCFKFHHDASFIWRLCSYTVQQGPFWQRNRLTLYTNTCFVCAFAVGDLRCLRGGAPEAGEEQRKTEDPFVQEGGRQREEEDSVGGESGRKL